MRDLFGNEASPKRARGRPRTRPFKEKSKTKFSRICLTCSKAFVTHIVSKLHCSETCRKKLDRRLRGQRRRAIRRGVQHEKIKAKEIFERDRWQCQICKRQTLKLTDPPGLSLSPELDHIMPLSKGGPHIKSNVQLLCRECNHRKGGKRPSNVSMSAQATFKEAYKAFTKYGASCWILF